MNLAKIQELASLATAADVINEKSVQNLLFGMGIDFDEEVAADTAEFLSFKALGKVISPDPFYPPPQQLEVAGPIEFGKVAETDHTFGLSLGELNQHVLLAGRSGSGKTTLLYNVMNQLLDKGIKFWCFDFKKEFRGFIKQSDDVIVLKPENLKFNPLRPPDGVTPLRWVSTFSDVFSHAHSLLEGSNSYLLDQVFNLYDLFQVFDGSNRYPSFHELMEILDHIYHPLSSRDARYHEVVKNRIQSSILTVGDMLDCDKGMIDDLIQSDKSVIFEFYGISEHVSSFLVEMILSKLYFYRMEQGRQVAASNPLIVFMDEARNIYDYRQELIPESGIPIIDTITERIRDFGVSLFICTQIPSEICVSAKSNTYSKIMMSLGNGKDIDDLSKCMGLSEEQASFTYNLGVGNAIIKMAGRYPRPFWISVPEVKMDKDISDFDLNMTMAPLLSKFNITNVARSRLYDDYVSGLQPGKSKKKRNTVPRIAKEFLTNVFKIPFIPVSKRYELLNLSRKEGKVLKDYLMRNKYVYEKNIKISNRVYKLIILTKKGFNYCEEMGHQNRNWNEIISHKVSFRHRFYQFVIKNFLTQEGWDVIMENHIENDKIIDVDARYGHKKIALEVAVSKFEIEDIQKCIDAGYDEVRVICPTQKDRDRVIGIMNGSFSTKNGISVVVQTINGFLEEAPAKK